MVDLSFSIILFLLVTLLYSYKITRYVSTYRVFRNLCDPLWELIVKLMKKSHVNMCPICLRLRDIMKCSVLITFTKDARNDQLAFEDKTARVLSFIWLLSLSFLVFLEFVGSLALFYFVVFQHFQSMFHVPTSENLLDSV